MVVAGRKIRDPIEGDTRPGPGRDRKRGQETERSTSHHLVARTRVAALHIALNCCSEPWPHVILGDE